ncbi:hypothetical protein [Nonomuraea sp. GTA35]|uniref:hypothetical protein n=1 Tax=Nonomuraea sp. GTA35 TaxID=1676746 RepID=UPI0035C0C7C2
MCERHGFARLVIGSTGPDGSIHTRHWTIPACSAEHLAARLGPPDSESVATPDGVANVRRAVDGLPGVVRVEGGAG